MPRPRKPRLVEFVPDVTYFKPAGVPMSSLDEVRLGVDELEALRLKDLEGLDQEDCAQRMNLAQSTFQRVLTAAREKLTRGIVEGRAIRIEGGNYRHAPRRYLCPDCGTRWEMDPRAEAEGEDGPPRGGPEESAADPVDCPSCGGREARPQWHRGRGHGPGPRRWRS